MRARARVCGVHGLHMRVCVSVVCPPARTVRVQANERTRARMFMRPRACVCAHVLARAARVLCGMRTALLNHTDSTARSSDARARCSAGRAATAESAVQHMHLRARAGVCVRVRASA